MTLGPRSEAPPVVAGPQIPENAKPFRAEPAEPPAMNLQLAKRPDNGGTVGSKIRARSVASPTQRRLILITCLQGQFPKDELPKRGYVSSIVGIPMVDVYGG